MKKTIMSFRVTLLLPPGANGSSAAEYIRSSIKGSCGGLDPEDPMFDLDRDSVRVSLVEKVTRYGAAK